MAERAYGWDSIWLREHMAERAYGRESIWLRESINLFKSSYFASKSEVIRQCF